MTQPTASHRKSALLIVISLPFVWGTTFPIVKFVLRDSSPLLFNAVRFSLTAIGFLLFSPSARQGLRIMLRPRNRDERLVMYDGLILGLGLGAGYALQVFGLLTTTASKSAFLTSTAIIWTPIFSFLLGREKPGKMVVLAIVIAIAGTLLLTHPYRDGIGFVFGDLLTLGCAVCFSTYIITVDQARAHALKVAKSDVAASLMITGNQLVIASLGLIVMLPFGPLWMKTDLPTISSLLYLVLFATAMTAYLQARYQDAVSPSVASVIYMLEPVMAAVLGYFFLTERMGTEETAGALLIVLAVFVAQVPMPTRSKSA